MVHYLLHPPNFDDWKWSTDMKCIRNEETSFKNPYFSTTGLKIEKYFQKDFNPMCPNGVERPALSAYHVCLVAPSIGPAQFSAFDPKIQLTKIAFTKI